ncbi:MAG: 30S ribosome-binding factor RbfA [Coriobacteriales bacterium]|jgi:ribosome-binding factor A|nr:30S ribosome-binding factor RbfA [Coriobacteriales bacterium]
MRQTSASHKLNETARAAFASLLLTEVSDPRLAMLTVTSVEVSRDRSVADIYIAADPSRYDEALAGLGSAKGRLRSLLGRELGWRVTPELRFFIDEGVDHAFAISEALKKAPAPYAGNELAEAQGDDAAAARGEEAAEARGGGA